MAEVRLEGVTKSFGGNTVVDDLSLTVRDKEFLTLVGPSGCGKSTTLRMICGLERVSAGQIYFDEQPVEYLPANKRDVAMVFQSYALYPHKTVEQNIGFALKMMRVPKDEIARQVREAADTLGIADLLDRRPRELSGGQRQRVALGRAIVREAGAYLLDEPLSNLDAQLRVLMRAEIKRLHVDLARTFIYVTHDQVEAMTMSDRIVVMKDGVVQQCATPQEIYDHPANRFVASFMGSPPMNFMEKDRAVLGIRPEDVSLSPEPREGYRAGKVFITEPLGADVLVTVDLDGDLIKARVAAPFRIGPDNTIHIGFDRARLHYFSVDDGRAIEGEAH